MKSEARNFLDLIARTTAPDFKVDEKLDEQATVAEILLPKPTTHKSFKKEGKRRVAMRKTEKRAPDVIMDVYMGVLEQTDKKPKIEELN